jgi:hypothetical protein
MNDDDDDDDDACWTLESTWDEFEAIVKITKFYFT